MIPNTLHFIFGLAPDFGGKPFSLIHALAIESAIAVNKPDKVMLHYVYHPEHPADCNEIWRRISDKVELCRIDYDTTSIFGIPLHHYAHRSDVVRLRTLLRHGGIYLDLDTICKHPFSWILSERCVLGMEGDEGLCNGVILAERDSQFLHEWLQRYAYFDNTDWNHHSVKLPNRMDRNEMYRVPFTAFHDPTCNNSDQLFERVVDFPDAYCHHLWETHNWDKYLKHLTPERIRNEDTTYNLIARQHLDGLGL